MAKAEGPRPKWVDVSEEMAVPQLIRTLNRRLTGLGDQISDPIIAMFNIDGGGGIIPIGDKMELVFPDFDAIITGWQIIVKPAATVRLDIWRKAYGTGLPLLANTIIANNAAKPFTTAAVENRSPSVERWRPEIAAGDKLTLNVDINDVAIRICLGLSGVKS